MGICQSTLATTNPIVYNIPESWFVKGVAYELLQLSECRHVDDVQLMKLSNIWFKVHTRCFLSDIKTNRHFVRAFLRSRYAYYSVDSYTNFFMEVLQCMRAAVCSDQTVLHLLKKLQVQNYNHFKNVKIKDSVLSRILE